MNVKSFHRVIGSLLFLSLFSIPGFAAPGPCQGPNKNDAGCNEPAPPPPSSGVVHSATVDWANQRVTVRGSDLDLVTDFVLGGSVPLTSSNVTPTELQLEFDTAMANAVMSQGNYLLSVDGTDVLSLFVKSQIISTSATGCPCETPWSVETAGLGQAPECIEILGPGNLDSADIAGTIYSDPDPAVYPHYPIGAAFIPSDPDASVCRLVQVNGDGTTADLVNLRINETQQEECATILKNTYCASTTTLP